MTMTFSLHRLSLWKKVTLVIAAAAIWILFSTGSSLQGTVRDIGMKSSKRVVHVSFDHDETEEEISLGALNIIFTPNSETISHGASLCEAITAGKKYYGYKYTSRAATAEKIAHSGSTVGTPKSLTELFEGEFFASVEQRADTSIMNIPLFETKNDMTFADSCNVTLEKDARYVLITDDEATTFTARGLSRCVGGRFILQQEYSVGESPRSVVVTDVDGDGDADIVTANSNANSVSVLRNLGSESNAFAAKADYAVGANPYSVAVGDINGDALADIVTANASSATVSVLFGSGDGTFRAQADPPNTGIFPVSIAIGDLNGDGRKDVVTANMMSDTISVFLGRGDGTFMGSQFATGKAPHSVAIADVDGNGTMDMVTANNNANTVSVLLGNGTGIFAEHREYATGHNPRSVAVADLNGDDVMDIVTTNYNGGTVSVLLGTGNGTFLPRTDHPVGFVPGGLTVADLDGDGAMDLAVTHFAFGNPVSVLMGNGKGGFTKKSEYRAVDGPYAITAADIDGDNDMDMAVANMLANTVTIFFGHCIGTSE